MSGNDYKVYNKSIFAFLIAFIAWLALVYSSLWSAIEIWVGNEIYNHCLIVIPASVYLIYEKREKLDWSQAQMSWLAALAFMCQLLFYVLGAAADIQLFQHLAIFSMLPTLVWIFIGNKLAWNLKFPLAFVLFAVPVGEELIPLLQEITADMSVYMLQLTGIPLFRSGLFIEIPQGKFLVAEACSGVSFLIASIVLGNLYAYMNLVSWRRRIFFVCLSIVFPIIANSVRVYGIIYIGYSTNMEHAVGADHLIYGWFFFAFVLVCLFLFGEFLRRNEAKKLRRLNANEDKTSSNRDVSNSSILTKIGNYHFKPLVLALLLISLVIGHFQVYRMSSGIAPVNEFVNIDFSAFEQSKHRHRVAWVPKYVLNSKEELRHLRVDDFDFDLYYANFDGTGGELVSSLNRLYQQDRWTLVDRKSMTIGETTVKREFIATSIGTKKIILYWYVIDGKVMSSYRDVKIAQLLQKLKGTQTASSVIALAIDVEPNVPAKEAELEKIASQVIKAINHTNLN